MRNFMRVTGIAGSKRLAHGKVMGEGNHKKSYENAIEKKGPSTQKEGIRNHLKISESFRDGPPKPN